MNNQSEEKQECIEYNHNNSNEVQYMPYYTAAHPGSYYEQQPYMAVQYDSAVPMPPIPAQYQVAPQAAWSQGYYNGQPATLPTSNSMPQPLMPQYAVYPPSENLYSKQINVYCKNNNFSWRLHIFYP